MNRILQYIFIGILNHWWFLLQRQTKPTTFIFFSFKNFMLYAIYHTIAQNIYNVPTNK